MNRLSFELRRASSTGQFAVFECDATAKQVRIVREFGPDQEAEARSLANDLNAAELRFATSDHSPQAFADLWKRAVN